MHHHKIRRFARWCGHTFVKWGEGIAWTHGYLTTTDIQAEQTDYQERQASDATSE